ncbi:MAG TPA: hypothetical protein PKO06_08395, partial [Candidatus Ozemobacteraceae bacterium]|nr:hypothetical protein [Candidatus Ozemobacteraceae bacterium]
YDIYLLTFPIPYAPASWVTTAPSLIATVAPGIYELHITARVASASIGTLLFHSTRNAYTPNGMFVGLMHRPFSMHVVPSATEPRSVVVNLRYGNQPYDLPPEAQVYATLKERKGTASYSVPVNVGSQSLRVSSMKPGMYRLDLLIDRNQSNPPGFSGDLFGRINLGVNADDVETTMLLTSIMRLRYPEDSDTPGLGDRLERNELVEMENPVTFAWEPLSDTATYTWSLSFGAHGTTTATAIVVDAQPGQNLHLNLSGRDASGTMGQLRIGYPTDRPFYNFCTRPASDSPPIGR